MRWIVDGKPVCCRLDPPPSRKRVRGEGTFQEHGLAV